MSYAYAGGLQARVYQRLIDDPALSALVGGAVYDAPLEPALGAAGPDYITLGEETVRPNGTKTSDGAIHDFTVTVHSGRDGFAAAKEIAAAVCDCLIDAPLVLEAGRLVALRFLRAGRGAGPGAGEAAGEPALPRGGGPGLKNSFSGRTTDMAAQRGKDLLIKLDMTGAGDFETVAGLRATRIAFNAETVDVTNLGSAGRWRELLSGAGVRSAAISGSGVFRDEATDERARAIFFAGEIPSFQVIVPDFGVIEGPFQITSIEYSGSHDGEAVYELALASAGAVSFAAI